MMPLSAQVLAAESAKGWLVWLHGFLGNRHEWQQVATALPAFSHLLVDLPGHGASSGIGESGCVDSLDFAAIATAVTIPDTTPDTIPDTTPDTIFNTTTAPALAIATEPPTTSKPASPSAILTTPAGNGFDETCQRLNATLRQYAINDYWLVGYSLGGRIAMYHACYHRQQHLRGLIVEGAHPGLSCPAEQTARYQQDCQWAQRLSEQPLAQVLDAWYRQPVFASLNEGQRQQLIDLRCQNNPQRLAAMLRATSLARQPDLRLPLAQLKLPFYYLCGERDNKFRALAASLHSPCTLIEQAGHNAHRENPRQLAQRLAEILRQHSSSAVNISAKIV